ncbi:MAG: MotA/TolQ/ExbB proton channel family protein [Saprospiraceae bacterium]|jgi:biopolymer transport protein ExbB|nr:MotA/TolQ/ExbB proton channel family protein [Chitinophagia bacterium]
MYFLTIFLQADTEAKVTQNILDIITKGGPLGIAINVVLLILSILAVYIYLERYFTIQKAVKIDESFMNNIRAAVTSGNIAGAKAMLANVNSPYARMVEKGIARIGKPLRDIDAAIENVGNLEIFKLEKNLSSLASISGAAPMIGFFGTVTGMILAFYKMASEQNVTPDVLAGGIYTALITTAFGLFIGIFSFVGYNYLVSLVDKVINKMEATAMEFMDLLQEPTA